MTEHKIVVVTGASRGIGRDIEPSLARAEIGVVLTYHARKDEDDAVSSSQTFAPVAKKSYF